MCVFCGFAGMGLVTSFFVKTIDQDNQDNKGEGKK
jgi:hypothetical protein